MENEKKAVGMSQNVSAPWPCIVPQHLTLNPKGKGQTSHKRLNTPLIV